MLFLLILVLLHYTMIWIHSPLTKISFLIISDATHDPHVKIKLYTVSVITTLLICMIIAAIVVVAECGTECSGMY
jgi:hypothetical protein